MISALIVDDEKHVREAIELLIDWESYQITKLFFAPEGATAIEIIKQEQPDLIFTDMLMPMMDGSELLEWIQIHHPASKTIVISGHDDFGYMRHAIKYGGMDYILKPIDEAELNEAVQKAVASIHEERQLLQQQQQQSIQINQLKPMYRDKILSSLLDDGQLYATFAAELEKEIALSPSTAWMQVACLSLDTVPQLFKDRFASNLDLLIFSLANIANELLGRDPSGYAFRNTNKPEQLVFLIWHDLTYAEQLITAVNHAFFATYGVRFNFGLGLPQPFPLKLPQAWQEANAALQQHNLLDTQTTIHHYDAQQSTFTGLHFSKYQHPLRLAVQSNNKQQLANTIADWFQQLQQLTCITKDQLELWTHEFTVFCTSCHTQPTQQPAVTMSSFVVPLHADGHLSLAMWQQRLTQYLYSFAEQLSNVQTPMNMAEQIASYIADHYQQDISLQQIAEHFSLSKEYVSRKFKQDTTENISDYIARIRIDHAKQLLTNPNLKIIQIADMIGYNDEKYFSKVFKKMVGISPNEYRRKLE
ncbi:response regulator [Paenibacillus yanchengensis]|uniref:Response regulator n=1 Tax=Paenibacillus yanchengensis TaxID=2035833 RepID=A0ABW4YJD6_9BACL